MRFLRCALIMAAAATVLACSTFEASPESSDAGASSSSGSGSSSGTSSTSSSSSSSGGTASGTDGSVAALPDGAQCSPTSAPCTDGSYCESPTCDVGFCRKKMKAFDNSYAPRCGCDGITYFNASVAIEAGVSTFTSNPCDATSFPGTKTCTRGAGACPAGTTCVVHTVSSSLCSKVDGACWAVPANCPPTPTAGACGTNDCVPLCGAMQTEVPWYPRQGCL